MNRVAFLDLTRFIGFMRPKMSLQTLDRTHWSFSEALNHVETVTIARRASEAARLPTKPAPSTPHWLAPPDPKIAWKSQAKEEILVALRDGDLIAQGRYTETRTGWANAMNSGFGMHSGYHSSIRPEEWREGQYRYDRLTAKDWEFIDIRMPRFLVKAIWPDDISKTVATVPNIHDTPYTTPYLELMKAAIAQFNLTAEQQSKKENLSDWFFQKEVDGEPLSRNLADAMATLVRLPSAQRGGSKRVL